MSDKTGKKLSDMAVGPIVRMLTTPLARTLLRGLMRGRASIFMMHRVANPSCGINGHSAAFVREAIVALRKSGAKFVPLSTIIDCWNSGEDVDPDWVAFTLDDGFYDQAELVEEVLAPLGCPATIFLITGFLDGQLWPWDDQIAHALNNASSMTAELNVHGARVNIDLSSPASRRKSIHAVFDRCKQIPNERIYAVVDEIARQVGSSIPREPPPRYRPMSWDKARQLERMGVEFGPHSVTHRIFSQISAEEARQEMSIAWRRLREEVANPQPIFAWPTGRARDFNTANMTLARELGFRACVATDADYAHVEKGTEQSALFRLRRFPLPYDLDTVLRYGSALERGRQLFPI